MATVEELRKELNADLGACHLALFRDDKGVLESIDSLIAAAREEGKDELQAIFDMLWSRMREWEDEWRAENPKERKLTSPDSIKLIEWKIAKARAEGAEHAKEEEEAQKVAIYKAFPHLPQWTEVERLRESIFAGHTTTANVDALCAAIAKQERERIRKTAQVWLTGDPPPNDTWYGVDKKELDPASVLASKETL
jgi:hypothetical protein